MTGEDRSKLQSLAGEIEGLKSRQPEESKFKDWKEKVEKKEMEKERKKRMDWKKRKKLK